MASNLKLMLQGSTTKGSAVAFMDTLVGSGQSREVDASAAYTFPDPLKSEATMTRRGREGRAVKILPINTNLDINKLYM